MTRREPTEKRQKRKALGTPYEALQKCVDGVGAARTSLVGVLARALNVQPKEMGKAYRNVVYLKNVSPVLHIGNFRISAGPKGKVTICALKKNGVLIDSGQFSEKKFAKAIAQFYAENF